jgi:hypothetical protein
MSAVRIAYVGQSESRIAHGSNVFHPIRTKWNVFGEDLSNIIPAKIDYNMLTWHVSPDLCLIFTLLKFHQFFHDSVHFSITIQPRLTLFGPHIDHRRYINVFGEDLSNIIPAKIDYNEPILRGFRGEDQNMHC